MSEQTKRGIDPKAADAVEAVYWAWQRFKGATYPLGQAAALLDVASAMSDVASWLPGYNVETGEVEKS
jgi:hypothetical protein